LEVPLYVYLLGQVEVFANKTPFDLIEYLITNFMQPIGALMLVLFVGWRMSGSILQQELKPITGGNLYSGWLTSVRYSSG